MITDKSVFCVLLLGHFLCFFSCHQRDKNTEEPSFAPKTVEARGYVVPKDSIADPKVKPAGKPKVVPVGNPKVVTIPNNVRLIGNPKVVIAGIPQICTPGQDSFSLPKTVPAIEKPFVAGIPEKVLAKEAISKEPNPHSFSSFGKQQGLNYMGIRSLLEDRAGNLWLTTTGGGVNRYDGKYFTYFTKKEGLLNGIVGCSLEDHAGNLWFGTNGGVTRYNGKTFTNFTEQEGLSNNILFTMLEDRSGNLWFGTFNGLNRYDGKTFTHFTTKEGLPKNCIYSIFEDHAGNIWIGTNGGGVCRYDGKAFTTFTEKEGLSNNIVRIILEDRYGNMWFGTDGGGVNRYDGKSFTHFTVKEGLTHNAVWTIMEDRFGKLWIGTGGGVSCYDGKSFTQFTAKEGLCQNIVFSSLEDRFGNLWFGTFDGGVSRYNGQSFNHFTDKEGLSNNFVFRIVEDRFNNIWFGTSGGGVNRYDGKTFTHFAEKEGLPHNMVRATFKDHKGNLWFGTEGGGISRFDGKTFTTFTMEEGLCNDYIRCFFEDHAGNLWIGTLRGGVSRYDGKSFTNFSVQEGLSNNAVFNIVEDRAHNLWFSTFGGGVTRYDGHTFTHFSQKEGLLDNEIRTMITDSEGNLWFGTYTEGVCRYDGQSFIYFTEKEGLTNNMVSSILEDHNGDFWFGTGSGLSMLSKAKLNLLTDKKTQKNIPESDILFKNYTYESGFLGIGCVESAILEAHDGKICIGTTDRLTVFNPQAAIGDTIAPHLVLSGLAIFNEDIPWANLAVKDADKQAEFAKDTGITLGNGVRLAAFQFEGLTPSYGLPMNLSLAYNNNYLTFDFTGITLFRTKEVKYQYKLEGFEHNWSSLNNRSEATYGNLSPGRYTFRVKAMNSEGYWSKEVSYTFTIRPPWWFTWWAYLFYAAFISGSIFFIYRFQLNRRLEQAEAHRIKELDAVKTRLYTNITHEFRTPLTIILGMADQIMTNPKDWFHDGIRLIQRNGQQLLQLVNQLLDLSKLESGTMPLHMKQGNIVQYVRYLSESFQSFAVSKGIDLHLKTGIDELYMDYDSEKIQNIVSNLLSNAIKYTPEGGEVTLTIERLNNDATGFLDPYYIQISVSDTGIGIPEEKIPHIFDRFYQVDDSYTRRAEGTGIGLTLTQELVHLLGGSIEVKSAIGKGSTFIVQLPITRHAPVEEVAFIKHSEPEQALGVGEGATVIDTPHSIDTAKPLVLIVEDNVDVISYLQICLKNEYRLESARNGIMGLEKSLDLIPDIIISDIMMPEMDGYELCQKLKTDVRTSHIPVVLLTAKADMDSKIEGLEYGADDYLAKPFQERELKARLKNLLSLRAALQERYRSVQYWQQPNETNGKEIKPTMDDVFLKEFKMLIEDNISDVHLDVHQLELKLGMSHSKIHRKLAALTNMSTTEFVRFVRLTKASEILRGDKNKTISEIAYDVGFTSLSYFTRRFTELYGVNPTDWRNKVL